MVAPKRRREDDSVAPADLWQGVFVVGALLAAALILSGAFTQVSSKPFTSSEVQFTDASHSGLQIVPASCPSDADYAGQCSLPVEGTCGLDVSLVMDVSGSIDNTELSQMKSALKGFTSALLPETPTLFSLVKFDNTATVRLQFLPYGNDLSRVNSEIDAIDGSGSTNWQGALLASQSTFDPRPSANNLVIFASDGNPNTINNGTGGYTSVSESTAVSAAVTVANSIKSSGTRILAIGIGSGLDAANLQAIASPNSVFSSNFSTLATDLASIAREQCGGTITVKKIYDVDGNLGTTNDQAPASGWDFTVAGVSKTTDFLGYTEPFRVSGFGPWSVEEIQQSGHTILGASCTGATDNGTLTGTIVDGIIGGVKLNQDNIVSCTFYNTGGTLGPDLTALNTSPTSATVDVATTLSAIITNAGVGSTGSWISFYNFFQVASEANGGGTITDLTPAVSLSSLRGGTSNDISLPHTFTAGGTYSTRACADKSSSTDAGTINEGAYENNNCSEWVNVNVPVVSCPTGQVLLDGVCVPTACPAGQVLQSGSCVDNLPDLTAVNTSPGSATINAPFTLSATIMNRGPVSIGVGFNNFFQVAGGAGGTGTIVDLTPAIHFSALAAGASSPITATHTFLTAGSYSVRACADKSSATDLGAINEGSNEDNNCSAWIDVVASSITFCSPGSTLPECQGSCPSGTTLMTNGECLPNGCTPGSTLSGCVPQCPVGESRDVNGQCVPTSCFPGYTLVGGVCVPIIDCPIGSIFVGNSCQFMGCPSGYTETSPGVCTFIGCPTLWTLDPSTSLCVPPLSCTNVCSGNNVVNSCTGALVQMCTNGCSVGGCIGTAAPAITSWSVIPLLVRVGTSVNVFWTASNVSSCSVTATNGDGTGSNATGVWSTPTGAKTSSPIASQTVFTIVCQGLPGSTPSSVSRSSTVNVLPTFEENCAAGFVKVNGTCVPI